MRAAAFLSAPCRHVESAAIQRAKPNAGEGLLYLRRENTCEVAAEVMHVVPSQRDHVIAPQDLRYQTFEYPYLDIAPTVGVF